jgi:hypothetical protein
MQMWPRVDGEMLRRFVQIEGAEGPVVDGSRAAGREEGR